ncbi:MAG: citrate synthase [Acidimicrobiales bacterium]
MTTTTEPIRPDTPAADAATTGAVIAPPGLKGLVVADTTIGEVRGAEGFYHYRGRSVPDLARSADLESVWSLLVDGEWPAGAERAAFAAEVAALRSVPRAAIEAVVTLAQAPALTALRAGLITLGADARPVIDCDRAGRRHDALRVAAAVPTLVAAHHRAGLGLEPVAPDSTLPAVADYLRMLTGEEAPDEAVAAVQTYLIATLDHGFNASTFTARVVTSTGADVPSAVVAAIGALSGPLHGGAPSRVLDMLDDIVDPGRAAGWVRAALAQDRRIMGFGHAVYRDTDPRSRLLREVAEGLGGDRIAAAVPIERVILETLAEAKEGRRFATNVEYYAAVALEAAGIPRDLFTPTFVASRVIGWIAHILEQSGDRRIIRPSSRYVGPSPTSRPVGAASDHAA